MMRPVFPARAEEADLNYEVIIANGGTNYGDEDFDVFKCPNCTQIYLAEYEVDTVFLDPTDLSKRAAVDSHTFTCTGCGRELPIDEPWYGENARVDFHVPFELLKDSPWRWILNNRRISDKQSP